MDDDTITFKIIPDKGMTVGFAYLLVSYEDYLKFESLKWNMEKPSGEYKSNSITFKSPAPSEGN